MDTVPALRALLCKARPGVICTAVVCVLCALIVVWWAPTPAAAAANTPAIKRDTAPKQTPEQQYTSLKKQLAQLTSDNRIGNRQDRWQALAQSFYQMHLTYKKEGLGANSLFMCAQVYRMMHQRFGHDEDAQSARQRYLQLADLYPGHTLADDALFEAAGLADGGKQAAAAEALYRQILAQYPQGDQVEKTKKKLAAPADAAQDVSLAAAKPDPVAPTATAPSADPPASQKLIPTSAATNFSQISPAKFWLSQQYSRIVFTSAVPVPFTVKKLANQPAQLMLELQQSTLDAKYCRPQLLDQGLLKQIQPTLPEQGLVRFLVDLEPFADYKVFTLQDPFRVVVDIYGYPAGLASSASPTDSQEPAQASTPVRTPPSPPLNEPSADVPVLVDQKKIQGSASSATESNSKHEQLSLAQQLGLGVKTIVIDPGHGGKDPGAMAFGLKEKDIVLKVAQKLAKILKQTSPYQVVLTRSKDVFIPLEKRTAMANAHKADLFISIHINAHADQASSGIETYFLNLATDADAMRVAALENASSNHSIGELQDILSSLMNNFKIDESSRLARYVQNNLISGLKTTYKPRDLGVKQAPFYVLIGAEMPAILAELSFITNPTEAKLLQEDTHLEKLATQLAGGIVAYIDHHHAAAKFP